MSPQENAELLEPPAACPRNPLPYVSFNLIFLLILSKDIDVDTSTEKVFLSPFAFPFLVVITITPFAALEPQSAAADAPLKISIDSTSLGLISFNLDCWVTPPPEPTLPPEPAPFPPNPAPK